MIGLGAELVQHYHWILYLFGGLLLLAAVKMLLPGGVESDSAHSWPMRMARRVLPLTSNFDGSRFLTRIGGRTSSRRWRLALVVVES